MAHSVIVLEMTDDRLDGCTAFDVAFDLRRGAAALAMDVWWSALRLPTRWLIP